MNTIDYIGKPWQRGGFDCWALVRSFYLNELAICLPRITALDNANIKHILTEFEKSPVFSVFEKVDKPQNYDVVGFYFEGTKRLGHVGVYFESSRSVLHCPFGGASVVQHLGLFERMNCIEGFYRYRV